MSLTALNSPVRIRRVGRSSLPDLVLIHGWGSCSAIWTPLLEVLQQRFCLHLVDIDDWSFGAEGIGQASKRNQWVNQLEYQLPGSAIWCGWSLGGSLAACYAAQHPGRVRALIGICSTPLFVATKEWSCGMQPEVFDSFRSGLRDDVEKTLQRFTMLVTRGSPNERADLKQYRQLSGDCPSQTVSELAAGLDLLGSLDNRDLLQGLRMPVLQLFAENDALVSLVTAERVKQLSGHLEIQVVEGASHIPWLSQREQFLKRLMRFLEINQEPKANA